MIDIIIKRGRDRAYLMGESSLGKKWLNDNIQGAIEGTVVIHIHSLEDMIIDLQDAHLEVEVH